MFSFKRRMDQDSSQKDSTSTIPWPWIRAVQSIIDKYHETNEQYNQRELPVELSPWLYISDENNALNHKKLLDLGITHVLSLNGVTAYKDEWARDLYNSYGIIQKRVHAEDREGYDMIGNHWEECLRFLEIVTTDPNNKVVVHCVAGINRSGLIACAAYMLLEDQDEHKGTRGVEVLDSVSHCVNRRGSILSNKSFQKQLCCLAAQHNLLGERPSGYSDDPIEEKKLPPPPIKAFDRLLG